MILTLRVIYRGTCISVHLISAYIISIIAPILFGKHWHRENKGKKIVNWWVNRTSKIIGLDIHQQGRPPKSNTLIAANHISFLDIVVIASVADVTFLSKSTLRFWPIIGFTAKRFGTIFIQRNKGRTIKKITDLIANTLTQNRSMVIFPEGTTTTGEKIKKFHSGLFQAAINTNTPVQPVALSYIRDGKLDRTAAYIERDNFIISLIKIISQDKTDVYITFLDTIESDTFNRMEIAKTCQNRISRQLSLKAKFWQADIVL